MADWTVVCCPCGDAGDEPTGLCVLLTDGTLRHEVARVAFRREASANPEVGFVEKLREKVAVADEAAAVMNELADELDRLADDAALQARDRLRRVLGAPSAREVA